MLENLICIIKYFVLYVITVYIFKKILESMRSWIKIVFLIIIGIPIICFGIGYNTGVAIDVILNQESF